MIKNEDGSITVKIFDKNKELKQNVTQFVTENNIQNVKTYDGQGEIIGGQTREEAARNFDKEIELYEGRVGQDSQQATPSEGNVDRNVRTPETEITKPRSKEKANVYQSSTKEIHPDEKRFQNGSKLDQCIVDNIAKNYDPNQMDPVVVWVDPKDSETKLIAGFHRFAGAKKAGVETISVRYFEGMEKSCQRNIQCQQDA